MLLRLTHIHTRLTFDSLCGVRFADFLRMLLQIDGDCAVSWQEIRILHHFLGNSRDAVTKHGSKIQIIWLPYIGRQTVGGYSNGFRGRTSFSSYAPFKSHSASSLLMASAPSVVSGLCAQFCPI